VETLAWGKAPFLGLKVFTWTLPEASILSLRACSMGLGLLYSITVATLTLCRRAERHALDCSDVSSHDDEILA
jgi:hypothetical protein